MAQLDRIGIEAATQADLKSVKALLAGAGLPDTGVDALVDTLLVARDSGAVVGCAALELYGSAALLRSVAVAEPLRGRGVGVALTEAALVLASLRGAEEIYLLTETASRFFARFGFDRITRSQVSGDVLQSVEFTSLCPESAVVMRRRKNRVPATGRDPDAATRRDEPVG